MKTRKETVARLHRYSLMGLIVNLDLNQLTKKLEVYLNHLEATEELVDTYGSHLAFNLKTKSTNVPLDVTYSTDSQREYTALIWGITETLVISPYTPLACLVNHPGEEVSFLLS